MIVYHKHAYSMAYGSVDFFFTKPPTDEDVAKQWEAWVGDEKVTPDLQELRTKVINARTVEVKVVDN